MKQCKTKYNIVSHHAQVSFIVKDELVLPHVLYLRHILWEQEGLLYGRGYVTPNAAIEVPYKGIVSQGLPTEHRSWQPCL